MSDDAVRQVEDVTEVTSKPKSKSKGLDTMTKRLLVASAVLVALILVMTGAIVYFASLGRTVPRTAIERDMIVARQQTHLTPRDPNAWIALVSADIAGGDYDEAASGLSALKLLTDQAVVPLLRGDLATAKGDLSGARSFYAQAAAQGKKDRDAELAKAAESGVNPSQVKPSQPMIMAYLALGRLDVQAKDYLSAVKDLKAAVAADPTAADSQAALGDAQALAGQKQAAAVSYRNALKFVPDFKPALDGLKRLEEGR
jgi:tetratricopeptide (TPR) repeat protein